MRNRQPERLKLKPKDARELQRLLRDGHTPQRVAQRARILLACAQAEGAQQVARKLDQHRTTVWRVCERYRQAGLAAALYDAPRAGRPRVFSPPPTPPD
jgi:DNA invertase Pin-like site-specific DNA recombinase